MHSSATSPLNELKLQHLNYGMRWNNEDTNRSYSVDGTREAVIGYGSISGFNWPQRLAATHKEAAGIHYLYTSGLNLDSHCLTLHIFCQRSQS